MKRFWFGVTCIVVYGALNACTGPRVLMQTAPSTAKGAPASPVISAKTPAEWDAQKPQIKQLFEKEIYGGLPLSVNALGSRSLNLISDMAFDGTARIEEGRIGLRIPVHDNDKPTAMQDIQATYRYVLVTPKDASGPVPVIMMENFCPNHAVIPIDGITVPAGDHFDCNSKGAMSRIFGYVFGRYIVTPPIKDILARGYAIAAIYPNETFPDDPKKADFYKAAPNPNHRWGAISAWAYQFMALSQVLKQDERLSTTIAYGHSRYGKSALVAAAFDSRIDAVIAHQSGTGGASLSRDKKGESVAAITQSYPHWFTPAYTDDNLSVDQHHLLALIAPRPIMLGNAKRDVWSDPDGAFRAAQGASPAYKVYGSEGLTAQRLDQFRPQDDIAFWMRPGTHGVVEEDWPAFLKFLDAHFKG